MVIVWTAELRFPAEQYISVYLLLRMALGPSQTPRQCVQECYFRRKTAKA
jgi:hypothetical protein